MRNPKHGLCPECGTRTGSGERVMVCGECPWNPSVSMRDAHLCTDHWTPMPVETPAWRTIMADFAQVELPARERPAEEVKTWIAEQAQKLSLPPSLFSPPPADAHAGKVDRKEYKKRLARMDPTRLYKMAKARGLPEEGEYYMGIDYGATDEFKHEPVLDGTRRTQVMRKQRLESLQATDYGELIEMTRESTWASAQANRLSIHSKDSLVTLLMQLWDRPTHEERKKELEFMTTPELHQAGRAAGVRDELLQVGLAHRIIKNILYREFGETGR